MREIMRPDVVTFSDTVTCGELLERYPPGSIKWIALVDADEKYVGLCDLAEVAFSVKSPEEPAKDFARQQSDFLSLAQSLEDAMLWFEIPGREAAVVVSSRSSMEIAGFVTESYVLKRYAQELERRRNQ